MGHQWQDIQNYTYGQLKIFLQAAQALEAKRRANQISDLRLAAWGQGEDVKHIVNTFQSLD